MESVETKTPVAGDRISMSEKVNYAFGDLGCICVFGLVGTLLQKFYTDVLYINASAITIMFLVARLWDGINDPIWGRFIDSRGTNKTSLGRYRIWVRRMTIPLAISAVLMFLKIPGLTPGGYLVIAYVTYIAFGMLYTTVNIAYGSLSSVITANEMERSTLSIFRSIGSGIGGLPAMLIASLCYDTIILSDGTKKEQMSYEKLIIGVSIAAVLCIVFLLLCYKNTTERIEATPRPKAKKGETSKIVLSYLKSRPFFSLCLASAFLVAAQLFVQTYYSYIFDHYFNMPQLYSLVAVCTYLPVVVLMFFTNKLIRVMGKKSLCALGLLLAAVCNFILFFLQTSNVVVFLVMCFLSGIGSTFFVLEIWAMVNDVIDYQDVKTGNREEATTYAFFSFTRKMGHTIAGVLSTQALEIIGYQVGANIVQSNTTIKAMYNIGALIPALLFLAGGLTLWFLYPLSLSKIRLLQQQKAELFESRKLSRCD
ncbi:MAG: glycoside-pentoside-hexuronide (GPH):cation symporter [Christensenellaceae bacterium]|jgi:GPH family glycoside/pentoside/hexuronide:cation symporter|nr:glycoside-pentoside-hexuronide (GPH):cation symporter [Christensenellaceae bacterium]